ncbi:hypothetical protein UCRNP2_5252 [Neofusicoccum parvum UCRNP2]|uniref:Secreted protein n=2 Tax=Neofusicoccum parvum TaxID=310453 RepID=R1G933_BOTPV|nr:hypothetical protein UCRNP2_5252 [Neofusicoccum parvum UCRNP2]GME38851.1 hypothetical protein NpPPO83_00002660 [Neofusicoccum parvum]
MQPTTLLALALTALAPTALACRQLSCAGDVCATSATEGAATLCELLKGARSGDTTLVGRDGCGWAGEPAAGVASALGCAAGLNRYTGGLAVWRANDIMDPARIGSFSFVAPDGKSTVGSCEVVKNVDC